MNGSLRKQLGLARSLVLSRRGPPERITAVLTERCHLRCDFCRLWEAPDDGAPTEEWLQVFEANPFLRWVNLSGGELFAKERLTWFLERMVQALPRLALLDFPTAGQRPDAVEAAVRQLLAGPIPRLVVSVSIDGGPEWHDRARGRDGAFDAALETYRRLRRLQCRRFAVRIGCTLTAQARQQAEELLTACRDLLPDFRDDEVHYNLAHHSGHYYRNQAFQELPEEPALEVLEQARWRVDGMGWVEWVYGRLARRALREGHPPVGCETIHHTLFVAPDLTVYPCSIWDRPLGNLRDHDHRIESVLDDVRALEARNLVDQRRCPGCFTPCEAVPAMLRHPLRSTWQALRNGHA